MSPSLNKSGHGYTEQLGSFFFLLLLFFFAATTRNLQRRSFLQGSSVTSAIASTSTTQRTAQRKRRCPTPRLTPPTTAIKEKSGPTATSARSSVTGPTPVTMTRPFNGPATPACTISTFAHVRRQYAVFWGCCFLPACYRVPSVLSSSVLSSARMFVFFKSQPLI